MSAPDAVDRYLRSLFMAWRARRHSLCEDPRHEASAVAHGTVGAAADQDCRHRTRQQDCAEVWVLMARGEPSGVM
jgi:hypothetical protein